MRLSLDRPRQRALVEQRRVEVALPVVPQLVRVGRQRRHRDPGPAQGALGVAGVEVGVEVAVLHHVRRDAEVVKQAVADVLDRRHRHQAGAYRLRHDLGQVRVDPHRELRRVGRLGELVQRLPDGDRLGIHEVEGVAVQVVVVHVRDVVHRAGDEVDRHEVRVAALRPGEREPLRQRVAEPLEQLEEVVGAVDLVHLARLRVADDHAWPVHAQRHVHLVAHDLLGLELRAVVGVRQLLALVEHVLAEQALELPGHRDRRRVVEAADVMRVHELDHVARALHVGAHHVVLARGHVVDRREVEEVVDLLVEVLDAQRVLRQVTHDGDEPIARVELLAELVEPATGALTHEGVDRPLALQQLLYQVPADEAGRPGYEVVHPAPVSSPQWSAGAYRRGPGPSRPAPVPWPE